MKTLLVIFSILIGQSVIQDNNTFNKKHIEILEKMADSLSNKFYLVKDEEFGKLYYGENTISFEIYTPLTEFKYKGTNEINIGLRLVLTDTINKQNVIDDCKNPTNDNLFDFVETKSYYGYINYSLAKDCGGHFFSCQRYPPHQPLISLAEPCR